MKYYKYKAYYWHYSCVPEDEGLFWVCEKEDRVWRLSKIAWRGIHHSIESITKRLGDEYHLQEISKLEVLVVVGSVKE